MEHNKSYLYGILAGVITGVVILAVFALMRKRKSGKCREEFDERQEIARGKAFQYGFIAFLIFQLGYGIAEEIFEVSMGSGLESVLPGICVGMGVFGTFSIWKEAYFGLSEKAGRFIILFAVITVGNMICGINWILEPDRHGAGNLWLGVLFLVLLVSMGIRELKNRREEE